MKKISIVVLSLLFGLAIMGCDFNSLLSSVSEQISTMDTGILTSLSDSLTETTTTVSEDTTTVSEETTSTTLLSGDDIKTELLARMAAFVGYGSSRPIVQLDYTMTSAILVESSSLPLYEMKIDMGMLMDGPGMYCYQYVNLAGESSQFLINVIEDQLYLHTLQDGTVLTSEILSEFASPEVFEQYASENDLGLEWLPIPEVADFRMEGEDVFLLQFPLSAVWNQPEFSDYIDSLGITDYEVAQNVEVQLDVLFSNEDHNMTMQIEIQDVPIVGMDGYVSYLYERITAAFPDSYEPIVIEIKAVENAPTTMDPDSTTFYPNEVGTYDSLIFSAETVHYIKYDLEVGYYALPLASYEAYDSQGNLLTADPYLYVTEPGIYYVKVSDLPDGEMAFQMAQLDIEGIITGDSLSGEIVSLLEGLTYSFPDVKGPSYLKLTLSESSVIGSVTVYYNSTSATVSRGETAFILVKPGDHLFAEVTSNELGSFQMAVETVEPLVIVQVLADMPEIIVGESNSTVIFLTPENPTLYFQFTIPVTGDYQLVYGAIYDWNMTGVAMTQLATDFTEIGPVYPYQTMTFQAGTYILRVSQLQEGYFFVLPWITIA